MNEESSKKKQKSKRAGAKRIRVPETLRAIEQARVQALARDWNRWAATAVSLSLSKCSRSGTFHAVALTKLDKSKCSRSNPDFANIIIVRHSEMFQFSVICDMQHACRIEKVRPSASRRG